MKYQKDKATKKDNIANFEHWIRYWIVF